MKILILFIAAIYLNAGIFDFMDIKKAKEAYEKKDYQKAAAYYEKLAKDGDANALFNLADSYYKAGEYKKALENFQKVNDKKLEFKKLHNMGNTYARLGKIDEAIGSYEKALKIKEDEDTRFNYELLKKKKERQKKKNEKQKEQNKKERQKDQKENKRNENKKKSDEQKKEGDQKDKKDRKDDRQKSEKKDQTQKERKGEKKDREKDKKSDEKEQNEQKSEGKKEKEKNKNEERNKKENQKSFKKKNIPISDMQERKYKKMLEQRGVNTLMMELPTKGENKDEIKPW